MENSVRILESGDFEILKEEPYVFARDLEIELMLLRKQEEEVKKKAGTNRIHVPSVRDHD